MKYTSAKTPQFAEIETCNIIITGHGLHGEIGYQVAFTRPEVWLKYYTGCKKVLDIKEDGIRFVIYDYVPYKTNAAYHLVIQDALNIYYR